MEIIFRITSSLVMKLGRALLHSRASIKWRQIEKAVAKVRLSVDKDLATVFI